MSKVTRAKAIVYMKIIMDEHEDRTTGEVNTTSLAEAGCEHFDDYTEDDDVPDVWFDWAFEAVYGGGN